MSIMFLLAGSIIGLVVVMPIQNHYDPNGGFGNFTDFGDFSQVSTIEMHKKDSKDGNTNYLWAYLVFTYIFTGILSYFLLDQSSIVSKRRQEYLGSQSSVADRTIKVSGIPSHLRDEGKLQEFMERLQIGDV